MSNLTRIFSVTLIFLATGFLVACKSKTASDSKTSAVDSSSGNLFIYTSFEEEVAQKIMAGFEAETGIKVQFVRLSTGEATARIEAEKQNPQASLWLGGVGIGHAELKNRGLSIPYDIPAAKSIPAKFKDPENYWSGIYIGILAFAVNPEGLKKIQIEAPASWKQLVDSKYQKQVEVANPGSSGTAYNLLTTMISKDGEEGAFKYLQQLNKNISQYTRSGEAPVKNVALGEALVGIGYAHDILRLIHQSKAPMTIVYPNDGTGYEIASQSLIKGGKQIETAKKLMNWIYSAKASQIFADHYVTPLSREGVALKKESLPPADLQLIDTNVDWAGKNKQRLIEEWNEKIHG